MSLITESARAAAAKEKENELLFHVAAERLRDLMLKKLDAEVVAQHCPTVSNLVSFLVLVGLLAQMKRPLPSTGGHLTSQEHHALIQLKGSRLNAVDVGPKEIKKPLDKLF